MATLNLCSCSAQPLESVYLGTDNVMAFVLRRGGVAVQELDPILRVVADVGGTEIDSSVAGSTVIWWTDQTEYKGVTVDFLQMRLGGQSLTSGLQVMDVTVFDASNPNGVLWGANIPVNVVAA